MSNVALLHSIRDQQNDMLIALKKLAVPVTVNDLVEIKRILYCRPRCLYEAEYPSDIAHIDEIPSKLTWWPSLAPVALLMERLDRYIAAASKEAGGG